MSALLKAYCAIAVVAVFASIWVTPWIAVVWLAVGSIYFGWSALRQQSDVAELLRDPAANSIPFSEAITRVRQRLKEGEQGLREREAEIVQRKQITNAIPDGLFLLNRENRILWCNQAALLMYSLDAFRDVGKPIGQLIRSPEFLTYLDDPARDEPIIHLDGRAYAMRLENTVDGSRLLLSRDVTERERLDRMRRDFIANVSHEMRTPLTVVGGYIETLRDLPVPPEEQRRYMELISTQTGNMQRLVEDLLILARLENDQLPIETTLVSLHSLAQEAIHDAKALSNDRHRIDAEISDVSIKGNARELRSAVSNLLTNAVRYTPRGGTISLSVTQHENDAVIAVTDTGVGIAAEHIPRLTERFYRVDRSRSRETGGTGLGLAIVKHVAQRHRGVLEVESELGRGSTFRLRLPLR
jgi:two-component system, OmpR family, phosphate regulon sensor histidine kinase PhoR